MKIAKKCVVTGLVIAAGVVVGNIILDALKRKRQEDDLELVDDYFDNNFNDEGECDCCGMSESCAGCSASDDCAGCDTAPGAETL